MSPTESLFPPLPKTGISFPSTPLLKSALEYSKQHTAASIVNHCVRSACFAVLLSRRLPVLSGVTVDMELVVYSCLMHDLGWATTKELLSTDKRFEVDSADIARRFVQTTTDSEWDNHRLQLSWDAIALHTIPSIALHKEPEVALVKLGVSSDFMGPNLPPRGLISPEEFKEIVSVFPRLGFRGELVNVMTRLCREKPETTFDNVASDFGCMYGLDGKGAGKEEFAKRVADSALQRTGLGPLAACEEFE